MAAHTLLSYNINKLFILSLSQEVVDGAFNSISENMGAETARKITWLKCDMGDWQAVVKTANKIASKTDRIDVLILNSARGIMT